MHVAARLDARGEHRRCEVVNWRCGLLVCVTYGPNCVYDFFITLWHIMFVFSLIVYECFCKILGSDLKDIHCKVRKSKPRITPAVRWMKFWPRYAMTSQRLRRTWRKHCGAVRPWFQSAPIYVLSAFDADVWGVCRMIFLDLIMIHDTRLMHTM